MLRPDSPGQCGEAIRDRSRRPGALGLRDPRADPGRLGGDIGWLHARRRQHHGHDVALGNAARAPERRRTTGRGTGRQYRKEIVGTLASRTCVDIAIAVNWLLLLSQTPIAGTGE